MQKMMCPLLLTHGVCDKQMPTSNARKLFGTLGSKDKMLKIFTAKKESPQNCQQDNLSLDVNCIAGWLMEKYRL